MICSSVQEQIELEKMRRKEVKGEYPHFDGAEESVEELAEGLSHGARPALFLYFLPIYPSLYLSLRCSCISERLDHLPNGERARGEEKLVVLLGK